MTFPDSGAPFGASPVIIFAVILVGLITLFVLTLGVYLVFFSAKQHNRDDVEDAPGLRERGN